MIRRILLVCSIALLAQISIPNPACAGERVAEETEEAEKPEGRAEWRAQLLAANQRVVRAEKRNAEALTAYEIMRHRRRPRGEGKQLIMDELALSREELASAQQNLEKTEKAARRAGAPLSWLSFEPAELEVPDEALTPDDGERRSALAHDGVVARGDLVSRFHAQFLDDDRLVRICSGKPQIDPRNRDGRRPYVLGNHRPDFASAVRPTKVFDPLRELVRIALGFRRIFGGKSRVVLDPRRFAHPHLIAVARGDVLRVVGKRDIPIARIPGVDLPRDGGRGDREPEPEHGGHDDCEPNGPEATSFQQIRHQHKSLHAAF
jgi:hypothetical protein